MTYENFKQEVTEKFKDYLPEELKERDVVVCSVTKVNRVEDALYLVGGVKNMTLLPLFI